MLEPSNNNELPPIPGKRYFTIGEVSELCNVKPHVLRYWEQELLNALVIVERGWGTPEEMRGSWAGAMGHTQWMPEVWLNMGMDYDRDGRVNPFGRPDDAREQLAALDRLAAGGRYISPVPRSLAYVALDDHDRAMELLSEAYQTRAGWIALLPLWREWLEPLESRQDFRELVDRLEFPNWP